jgi:Holliday junction resolvase RusA-like endonuclease
MLVFSSSSPHRPQEQSRWTLAPSLPHHRSRAVFVKKKMDVDNLAKLSLDCMTGVVYNDDIQVHVLKVAKCYDNDNGCEGRTKIMIHEVRNESELLTL